MNNMNGRDCSLDKEVNDLMIMEKNIDTVINKIENAKRQLCLFLAKIKINKLYEQIECCSFKDYISSNRLKISYNTALEYAKIGELLIKYEKELNKVDFCEEDGFKKMLFLEKALSHHEPDEVYKRIKENSFKVFAKYAKPARAGFTPKFKNKESQEENPPSHIPITGKWIFEENGKLYMDSNNNGSELLTFNKRLLEDANAGKEYKAFMANIIIATMEYYNATNK